MLISLAYEQGFLRRRALNLVQYWALKYWINMTRRNQAEDALAVVEMQTFSLVSEERWRALYGNKDALGPNGGIDEAGQVWRPVTDPRDLDKWFDSLAGQRGMTGEQAARMLDGSGQEVHGNYLVGFATGEGRRV